MSCSLIHNGRASRCRWCTNDPGSQWLPYKTNAMSRCDWDFLRQRISVSRRLWRWKLNNILVFLAICSFCQNILNFSKSHARAYACILHEFLLGHWHCMMRERPLDCLSRVAHRQRFFSNSGPPSGRNLPMCPSFHGHLAVHHLARIAKTRAERRHRRECGHALFV